MDFSLVAVSRGYSLVAMWGLLVAVASLGGGARAWACGLRSCDSQASEHKLSSWCTG